jgi:hypothetical protein
MLDGYAESMRDLLLEGDMGDFDHPLEGYDDDCDECDEIEELSVHQMSKDAGVY